MEMGWIVEEVDCNLAKQELLAGYYGGMVDDVAK